MKKILIIATIVIVGIIGVHIYVKSLYENYIRTSEELLWELEQLCEDNGIPWGDTICEGDSWSEYCDARNKLGLGYLVHHSKRN